MKLSTPGEMDEEMDEESQGGAESNSGVAKLSDKTTEPGSFPVRPGKGTEEQGERTVTLFGDEVGLSEAVEMLSEIAHSPGEFGLAARSRVEELEERVDDLEERNKELRMDISTLWIHSSTTASTGQMVIPDGDGRGVLPVSLDAFDPAGEFEGDRDE